jgi:hypothetical protein
MSPPHSAIAEAPETAQSRVFLELFFVAVALVARRIAVLRRLRLVIRLTNYRQRPSRMLSPFRTCCRLSVNEIESGPPGTRWCQPRSSGVCLATAGALSAFLPEPKKTGRGDAGAIASWVVSPIMAFFRLLGRDLASHVSGLAAAARISEARCGDGACIPSEVCRTARPREPQAGSSAFDTVCHERRITAPRFAAINRDVVRFARENNGGRL